MEDIKEVALRVARQVFGDGNMFGELNAKSVTDFASRLIAELQKDAKPVAWMLREKASLIAEPGAVLFRAYKPKEENIDSSVWDVVPLYTHPQPKAATVPEGWKLVPVEPTPEQVKAASRFGSPVNIYRAMLEAAPSLPALVIHDEPLRVIAVEAIREVTGCPDIKGNGKYLVDVLMEKAAALASLPAQSEGEQK